MDVTVVEHPLAAERLTILRTASTTNAEFRQALDGLAGMLIYEATRHYLLTVGTPKNSTEIAAALRAGGFKTRSKSLVNTVRVMLRRKDGRTTGISVTKDGTRWFVKRKAPIRTPKTPSAPK